MRIRNLACILRLIRKCVGAARLTPEEIMETRARKELARNGLRSRP